MTRPPPNFYQRLQVDPCADLDVINAAYKSQMRKIHPDQADTPENRQRAQELGEAKQTLTDPRSRRLYDATLQDQARAAHHAQEQHQEQEQEQHQAETYQEDEPERPRRRPRRAAPARAPRAPREQQPTGNPLLDFGRGLAEAAARGTTRKVAPFAQAKAEEAGEQLGDLLVSFLGGNK